MVKPEGKDYLGRPESRWKDNIMINFKEIGRDNADWQICLKVGKIGTTKFRWLNLKEKDFLGRPKSRWKDNIKTNFKEI